MKKILIVFMAILLVFNTAFAIAPPKFENKEFNDVQELVYWIQTANTEKFQDGRYHDGISALRENGELLVVSAPGARTISISAQTNPIINYYDVILDAVVHIKLLDKEFFWSVNENVYQYFKEKYSGSDFNGGIRQLAFSNGEVVDSVTYSTNVTDKARNKTFTYKDIGFMKDGFEIRVSFYPSTDFNTNLVKELSFELVSLKGSTDLVYTDVEKTDWYYDDVKYAALNGYIQETAEKEFLPNVPAYRLTIASALYNADHADGERPFVYTTKFVDVEREQAYSNAVGWAQSNGIVNGVGDNKFNPYGNVTRQDFAVMLWRYMKYCKFELPPIEDAKVFADDGEIADYAKEAVKSLNVLGIMNGKGDDIIDPRGNVTRAEAAAMLHRMMNKMK